MWREADTYGPAHPRIPPLEELPLFGGEAQHIDPPSWLTSPATDDKLLQAFVRFHRDNPHVLELLQKAVASLLKRERKRIAIAELVEELRYDVRARINGRTDFKINNSHRAFYARLLLHYDSRLEDVLETRRQTHKKGQ